ncbi:MAG: UDP-3-O-(3-hydroxymyristoyl)glucosamine N-acyltransferase [Betaproteobacteria bacterium CG2_30_68_42]|nr:MAG: UDP-3-O-(3-hydroxymyristoyl)glucosamine N-acyltransferase [Betaproteobacteria bacterium CG2_30_68_42]PJA56513.1 MAG: UDP-3-O-(3-hydroxymyristoyl)glucosamine N-acyltransferase [Rhodocyclales bacterium CG_4_9_14_3_um_filter_68_10]
MASGGVSLAELVARLGGELVGDGNCRVFRVATLESAAAGEISFLANAKYRARLSGTRADALILAPEFRHAWTGNRILAANPYLYFARVARLLNPPEAAAPGVHPGASVEAQVPASASIGAGCHVGPGAELGERVRLHPGAVVGAGCRIGEDSTLHSNVVIYPGCRIGARAIVHAGAVVGSDGFGFAREEDGSWLKIPQTGRVLVGDDVEIGAGTTIDRGAIDDTVIGDGVKIDNQVQIGHNVHIGDRTAIAGCVGIAGSARIGRRCMIGGAAMILGHLSIADDVIISAGTLIGKSVGAPGEYTGSVPFLEHTRWRRSFSRLRSLDEMADRIRALERTLARLEGKS